MPTTEPDMTEADRMSAQERKERKEREAALATRESEALSYLRWVVILIFLTVAAAVTIAVYFYSESNQDERFESSFMEHSSKLIDAFKTNAARRISAIDALSMAFTSHAVDTGATWPNVTLPDYERRASRVMDLADVIAIFHFPLVTNETRAGWEAYALEQQGWLFEGVQQRQEEIEQRLSQGGAALENEQADLDFLSTFLGDGKDSGYSIPTEIYQPIGTETGPEDGPGPYFPVWQWSPALPLPELVNFNAIRGPSHTKELEAVLKTSTTVTSQAFDFSDETDPNVYGRKPLLNLILSRWKGGGNDYEDGPVSDLYYPIYDTFDMASRKLVGVFDTLVYWQVYFVNVLPDNADGVVVVLENTCNQTFTYEVNGPTAQYLGQGDLHDKAYSEYEVSTGFGAFVGTMLEKTNDNYRHCSYNVKVFPSQTYEDGHTTNSSVLFTVSMACAFSFSFIVFILYDRLVERRQKLVFQTAVKSTEVVENLFPAQVRKGLYENNKKDKKDEEDDEMNVSMHDEGDNNPNAHNYPNCTVLFADLKGFTKWSNDKSPSQVFQLLEILYGSFDKIALKRNVFKVETVGDCYMACTGLPQPQPDHAVRMAKFAMECVVTMSKLKGRLVNKLGEEAGDLSIRVGLASGPVTGGVLRGSKARFQLFGDTVNTASRMETTGAAGRIQATVATADLLRDAGVEDWVRAREEQVEAKGKGSLQTYWIEVKTEGTVSSLGTSLLDSSQNGEQTSFDI